jgi:hypothetical protein
MPEDSDILSGTKIDVSSAYKPYNLKLLSTLFNCESTLVIGANFMIFPHICLIIRNFYDYIIQQRIDNGVLAFRITILIVILVVTRYLLKTMLIVMSVIRIGKYKHSK